MRAAAIFSPHLFEALQGVEVVAVATLSAARMTGKESARKFSDRPFFRLLIGYAEITSWRLVYELALLPGFASFKQSSR